IQKTSYVVTSNMVACFLMVSLLLGAGVAHYKNCRPWLIGFMVFFVLLLVYSILVFIAPLPDFEIFRSLPQLPRAELSYHSMNVQTVLQVSVVSSLFVMLFAPIFIVTVKGRVQQ
ncbi:unnamed protein product, partial [marine sediment metagenome]